MGHVRWLAVVATSGCSLLFDVTEDAADAPPDEDPTCRSFALEEPAEHALFALPWSIGLHGDRVLIGAYESLIELDPEELDLHGDASIGCDPGQVGVACLPAGARVTNLAISSDVVWIAGGDGVSRWDPATHLTEVTWLSEDLWGEAGPCSGEPCIEIIATAGDQVVVATRDERGWALLEPSDRDFVELHRLDAGQTIEAIAADRDRVYVALLQADDLTRAIEAHDRAPGGATRTIGADDAMDVIGGLVVADGRLFVAAANGIWAYGAEDGALLRSGRAEDERQFGLAVRGDLVFGVADTGLHVWRIGEGSDLQPVFDDDRSGYAVAVGSDVVLVADASDAGRFLRVYAMRCDP